MSPFSLNFMTNRAAFLLIQQNHDFVEFNIFLLIVTLSFVYTLYSLLYKCNANKNVIPINTDSLTTGSYFSSEAVLS